MFLFIYVWLHWVFIAARGLSLVAANGATLHCSAQASARVFAELVKNYQFEIVEFALATRNDVRSSAFARALQLFSISTE